MMTTSGVYGSSGFSGRKEFAGVDPNATPAPQINNAVSQDTDLVVDAVKKYQKGEIGLAEFLTAIAPAK